MKKDRNCPHCGQTFENIEGRVFSNHVRWCNKNPKNPRNKEYFKTLSKAATKSNEIRFGGAFKKFKVVCDSCGKKFSIIERKNIFPKKEKYFCCRSCANKRNHSEETKKKNK